MTAYSVSGTLSPDATTANTGEPAGTYNGQPYWSWVNGVNTFVMYFNGAGKGWKIGIALGGVGTWSRSGDDPPPSGTYTSKASGTATVAEVVEDESSFSSSSSGSSQSTSSSSSSSQSSSSASFSSSSSGSSQSTSSSSSSSQSSSSASSSQSSATVDLPRSCTITVTGSFQFTATIEETWVSENSVLAIGPQSSLVEKPT